MSSNNSEKQTSGSENNSQGHRVKINSVTPVLQDEEERKLLANARYFHRTNGPPYLKKKLPPKTMRISTVTVRRRNKSSDIQQKSHSNLDVALPGLKDCMHARPPINPELSGPTVFSYDPPKDRPEMTTFPSYTFRPKTQSDRVGGDRTAWGKEWFSHNYVWLMKADFDPRMKWPSPAHYTVKNTVGGDQPVFPRTPSHIFGKRENISFTRKGIENEPAPNAYNQERSKDRTMKSQVSFTIPQGRKKGTVLWKKRESVPGPGSYETTRELKNIKPRSAAFSFSMTPRKFDLETRCTF